MTGEPLIPSTALNKHPQTSISFLHPTSDATPSRQKCLMASSQPLLHFPVLPTASLLCLRHAQCFGNPSRWTERHSSSVGSCGVQEMLRRPGSESLSAPGCPALVALGREVACPCACAGPRVSPPRSSEGTYVMAPWGFQPPKHGYSIFMADIYRVI